jgi:hypothetical protein
VLLNASAQFSVSSNKHYLLKDGKPFFWLGDTGWEFDQSTYINRDSQRNLLYTAF